MGDEGQSASVAAVAAAAAEKGEPSAVDEDLNQLALLASRWRSVVTQRKAANSDLSGTVPPASASLPAISCLSSKVKRCVEHSVTHIVTLVPYYSLMRQPVSSNPRTRPAFTGSIAPVARLLTIPARMAPPRHHGLCWSTVW